MNILQNRRKKYPAYTGTAALFKIPVGLGKKQIPKSAKIMQRG
jgi:hypothetical protein